MRWILLLMFSFVASILFAQDLYKIRVERKEGFINKKGDVIISNSFDKVYNFEEDLAKIKSGSKYGFIDKSGKTIVSA